MNKLMIEPSPHIRSRATTQGIMRDVIIALCPALVMATYIFGLRALLLTVICATSCVLFEYLFNIITKKRQTIGDLSAVVTGIILAFNLPVTLPPYMAVIGCFVAIVIVKQLFGGIGQNFANPALVGRIVLMLSFTSYMTDWVKPFYYKLDAAVDTITTATPLVADSAELPSLLDMFLGFRGGCMGETCIAALLLGGLYLTARQIFHPITPVCFIGAAALGTFLTGATGEQVLYSLMSGGLVLGAIFMATDYPTTPHTPLGKAIFGIGAGLLTVVIREFCSMPEGVSFSILIMNILTPYIDMLTMPRTFGIRKGAK